MSDRESFSGALNETTLADTEAARVQDFADAVRHALHANKSKDDPTEASVLSELEAALRALDAWIEKDRTGTQVVDLFASLQNKTPTPSSDGTKPE